MKVFINKRVGGYSGGMVIVAANNVEEAQNVIFQSMPDSSYMVDIDGYMCHNEKDCVQVRNYHYKRENWVELFGVNAIFDIPTFIAEDGYSE